MIKIGVPTYSTVLNKFFCDTPLGMQDFSLYSDLNISQIARSAQIMAHSHNEFTRPPWITNYCTT